MINEHILKTFLASTPNVEDLDCELVYNDVVQQYLDCAVLKSALTLIRQTLKRLVLDIKVLYGPGWNPIPWEILGSMCSSLKSFTQLRYLDLPIVLYVKEIYEASQAANLTAFEDRKVDYWGEVMPDGLEWLGVGKSGPCRNYGVQYEVERCVDVYFRMNPGVKRIVPVLDVEDDEGD